MFRFNGVPLLEGAESEVRKLYKQAFRDEINAGVFCAIVSAAAYWLLEWWCGCFRSAAEGGGSAVLVSALLVLSGPLLEKAGFLNPYLWAAGKRCWQEARSRTLWSIPKLVCSRKFLRYLRRELVQQRFARILLLDIVFHDSFYTVFMWAGTRMLLPHSPEGGALPALFAGGIAGGSFLLALALAVLLEVKRTEFQFNRFLRRLSAGGAQPKRYGEIRFLVESDAAALDEFWACAKRHLHFGPDNVRHHREWSVTGVRLPQFNEWRGFMQVRYTREHNVYKLHVVFYRPRQMHGRGEALLSVLYIEKIKLALQVGAPTIAAIRETLGVLADKCLGPDAALEESLTARRTFGTCPDTLSASVDELNQDGGDAQHLLVEVKFWERVNSFAALASQIVLGRPWRVYPTTQPRAISAAMVAKLTEI